jgi:hypothetical protein
MVYLKKREFYGKNMPYKQPPKEHQFKEGNPGRPKGTKNKRTIFNRAMMHVGEALGLGKEPDTVAVELVKVGIRKALKGNFSFYKDILDRLYGKPRKTINVDAELKTPKIQELEIKLKKFLRDSEQQENNQSEFDKNYK